jgi:beta-glucanase (GH16 family)
MRAEIETVGTTCVRTRNPRTAALRCGAVAFAALTIATAFGATAASAHRAARVHMASHFVSETVNAAGNYEVVVSLRARGKHERNVRVYLTGQRVRKTVALPWWGPRLRYRLYLTSRELTVRAVNAAPAVQIRVTMTLERPASPTADATPKPKQATPASPASTTATTAPPASGPSEPWSPASTPASTPAPVAPAPSPPSPPPAPAPAPNPYTNLVWEDNFAQDFINGGSVPNQLPNKANWSLDSWSGCGEGTMSTPTPNGSPNADKNAYLTANGLAITALQTGPYSYSSAQLDSIGPQSSPESFQSGGTIEASMALPAGDGLCPAFWMLADSPMPGATTPAEIDVLEAPSFGPLPTVGYFDLHGPTGAGEFQGSGAPAGWNPTAFHTYGVIWTPTSITWTIDGVAYSTATAASVPPGSWTAYQTGAFHLIFDLSVGGWACGGGCSPPPSSTMYLQWVKVFN